MAASHFVTANDIRQHFLRDGGGKPLILLHGWPEFSGVWQRLIARLADAYDLIAPDFRGFGQSDNPHPEPTDAVTADVLAGDVLALLDKLGVSGPCGFVGHDVGAYVMQALARRAPERVAGLFFFNCPYPGIGKRWSEPEHLKEIWYQSFHQKPWAASLVGSSRATCRIYFEAFLRHWSGRPDAFSEAEIEAWVDNFMRPGNLQGGFNWYIGANKARLATMRGDLPPAAPVTAPTRVLWGGRDPVLKAAWRDRIPEFFPNVVEVSVAEEAGHFVHHEEPDLAAREIRRFFTGLGYG